MKRRGSRTAAVAESAKLEMLARNTSFMIRKGEEREREVDECELRGTYVSNFPSVLPYEGRIAADCRRWTTRLTRCSDPCSHTRVHSNILFTLVVPTSYALMSA